MSTFNHDLFKTIAQAHSQLRKSERKVADYVLEHRAKIVQMRIVDLAAAAAVSEPTVVRFCRALDFEGFQDFKLKLAQFVGANTSYQQFRLDSRDSVEQFKEKIFDSTMGNLMRVKSDLDAANLEQAIVALAQSKRVDCYGFGHLRLSVVMHSISSSASIFRLRPIQTLTCKRWRLLPCSLAM
jgi:RpiR family carbohydrate utilization transcriptional regulator